MLGISLNTPNIKPKPKPKPKSHFIPKSVTTHNHYSVGKRRRRRRRRVARETKRNQKELKKMGTRLGRRVIHFANLPIKLLMPNKLTNIDEIALKTIPSATKVEIRRVLESLYGFEVAEVRTLNMEGKKKKRGGILLARPDYKKAYVTLRRPLSISGDLFPLRVIADAKSKADKPSGPTVVSGAESEPRKHWLHGREVRAQTDRPSSSSSSSFSSSFGRGNGGAKFPWSSMRSKISSDYSKGSR